MHTTYEVPSGAATSLIGSRRIPLLNSGLRSADHLRHRRQSAPSPSVRRIWPIVRSDSESLAGRQSTPCASQSSRSAQRRAALLGGDAPKPQLNRGQEEPPDQRTEKLPMI